MEKLQKNYPISLHKYLCGDCRTTLTKNTMLRRKCREHSISWKCLRIMGWKEKKGRRDRGRGSKEEERKGKVRRKKGREEGKRGQKKESERLKIEYLQKLCWLYSWQASQKMFTQGWGRHRDQRDIASSHRLLDAACGTMLSTEHLWLARWHSEVCSVKQLSFLDWLSNLFQ